jgi:predicted TIM-barrel fold metal-dependent hydrolase
MIVDTHTRIWQGPTQLGLNAVDHLARPVNLAGDQIRMLPRADGATHLISSEPADYCFVLGFKSMHLGAEIPNRWIADYCAEHSERMVGFAGIDPADPDAIDKIPLIAREPTLKGIVVSPAAADIHPCDTQAMEVYETAARHRLPIVFDIGPNVSSAVKLQYARPGFLDEVARSVPELRMVITQLGYPWLDEALAILQNHKHIFADIGALLRRPWIAYDALRRAWEMEVMDKLLFGSDFPFMSATDAIEALFNVNQLVIDSGLPKIPRPALEQLVERDAISLLQIDIPRAKILANLPRHRRMGRIH